MPTTVNETNITFNDGTIQTTAPPFNSLTITTYPTYPATVTGKFVDTNYQANVPGKSNLIQVNLTNGSTVNKSFWVDISNGNPQTNPIRVCDVYLNVQGNSCMFLLPPNWYYRFGSSVTIGINKLTEYC